MTTIIVVAIAAFLAGYCARVWLCQSVHGECPAPAVCSKCRRLHHGLHPVRSVHPRLRPYSRAVCMSCCHCCFGCSLPVPTEVKG